MTAEYDKLGLHFLYPENWKLIDDADGQPHVLTLEAPQGGCTWSAHVYPADAAGDEMLREATQTLQETYEDLELEPCRDTWGQHQGQGVEALFYCLDFLIRARLIWVPVGSRGLLIWTQAEERDFQKQSPVFQAITTSLLQSLAGAADDVAGDR